MTGPSLDNLPPEILDIIVDMIEDEDGWDEYPTDALLNMRETCRSLERACHKRFLLYFHEWVIDLEKDPELSITKAVLASHVHAAAINKITFVYKINHPGLWKIAPLLHEVFSTLASFNRKLVLVFDPYADFEAEADIHTGEVVLFINKILVFAATSKLAIGSIHVRARRQDWDKRYVRLRHHRLSMQAPHHTFAKVDHGTILVQINGLLMTERHRNNTRCPRLLVAKYPGKGEVSFDYRKGCLKIRNLQTFQWHEFRYWIKALECSELQIKGCNLNPRDLFRVLAYSKSIDHPIRRMSITDTSLFKETSRDDGPGLRTSMRDLIAAITPYKCQLERVHLANIRGDIGRLAMLGAEGEQGLQVLLQRLTHGVVHLEATHRARMATRATQT